MSFSITKRICLLCCVFSLACKRRRRRRRRLKLRIRQLTSCLNCNSQLRLESKTEIPSEPELVVLEATGEQNLALKIVHSARVSSRPQLPLAGWGLALNSQNWPGLNGQLVRQQHQQRRQNESDNWPPMANYCTCVSTHSTWAHPRRWGLFAGRANYAPISGQELDENPANDTSEQLAICGRDSLPDERAARLEKRHEPNEPTAGSSGSQGAASEGAAPGTDLCGAGSDPLSSSDRNRLDREKKLAAFNQLLTEQLRMLTATAYQSLGSSSPSAGCHESGPHIMRRHETSGVSERRSSRWEQQQHQRELEEPDYISKKSIAYRLLSGSRAPMTAEIMMAAAAAAASNTRASCRLGATDPQEVACGGVGMAAAAASGNPLGIEDSLESFELEDMAPDEGADCDLNGDQKHTRPTMINNSNSNQLTNMAATNNNNKRTSTGGNSNANCNEPANQIGNKQDSHYESHLDRDAITTKYLGNYQ